LVLKGFNPKKYLRTKTMDTIIENQISANSDKLKILHENSTYQNLCDLNSDKTKHNQYIINDFQLIDHPLWDREVTQREADRSNEPL
jgi:hypothetical protein